MTCWEKNWNLALLSTKRDRKGRIWSQQATSYWLKRYHLNWANNWAAASQDLDQETEGAGWGWKPVEGWTTDLLGNRNKGLSDLETASGHIEQKGKRSKDDDVFFKKKLELQNLLTMTISISHRNLQWLVVSIKVLLCLLGANKNVATLAPHMKQLTNQSIKMMAQVHMFWSIIIQTAKLVG